MNIAEKLGGWSARHRIKAITLWLLFVVVASVAGGLAGQQQLTDAEEATGDSRRAIQMLEDARVEDPSTELVLLHTADPAAVKRVIEAIEGTGLAEKVRESGRTDDKALVTFDLKDEDAAGRVEVVTAAVAGTGVKADQFGDATADAWFEESIGEDFKRAEWTAVPLALGILLIAFGALVAAVLPVLLALTAFAAASGLLALVSHQMHVADTASSVMLLMGLAVGVDYCLFYLRREREERALGRSPEEALRIAARTSGHSVLVSGVTVVGAMAGMFLSGMALFESFAVATIMVVLIAMLGSVTVLPAILSLLGDKVDAGRLRRRKRGAPRRQGRFLGPVLRGVLARPGVSALLATTFLLVLAAPALGMKTQLLGLDQLVPASDPLAKSYAAIEAAFPSDAEKGEIVVRGDAGDLSRLGEVREDKGLHRITVPMTSDADLAAARAEAKKLDALPGVEAAVSGERAFSSDFNDTLTGSLGLVAAFVAGVAFLVMLVSFRSVVIAVTSIVLTLLSVGAAFGVIVAVFQHGWGDELVGTTAPGAVEAWLPLFVFVVLFGLSMDYHVFVVSRIREARLSGLTTRDAVARGLLSTAGVVTGAAAIMVAVFGVFATLSMQDFKQMGVGLAVAILLDATIVRAVLLPSVMALLGERNWSLRASRRPAAPLAQAPERTPVSS